MIRLVTDTVGLAGSVSVLDGVLASGNSVVGNLFYNPNENINGIDGYFFISASMIAGYTIGGTVIRDSQVASLRKSIVWLPGNRASACWAS